jgi:hypothetical protein
LGWALDVGFGSNGHDGPETRLPVFSEQRTLSVAVGMSQTCQYRKSSLYPEAKLLERWVGRGRPINLAYVVGYFVMLAITGWHLGSLH